MRDHIRREAAQSLHTAWWLAPVAFAAAALAAVALIDAEAPEPAGQIVAPGPELTAPAVLPAQYPMPAATAESGEHVQAF